MVRFVHTSDWQLGMTRHFLEGEAQARYTAARIDAIRSIGVTEVSYYRWRREFGGLKTDQVKRMKELEAENARLRRAVADLTLDKLILKEAASGNW